MARAATAAARAAAAPVHAPRRTRTAPAPPRRRSGPLRGIAGGAAAAPAPIRVPAPTRAPARRAPAPARRTTPRARRSAAVRAPRGAQILDRLLRGRLWIALVGALLVGVVFLNVRVLQLNEGIARMSERATVLKRENVSLRTEYASLASSERIQRVAAQQGLVLPEPGDVVYLRATPGDARRAARNIGPRHELAAPPAAPQVTGGAPAQTERATG